MNGTIIISGTVSDPDLQGIEKLQIRIGSDMDWTKVQLESKNQTVWSHTWDTTQVSDKEYTILVRAYDGITWSVPASRVVTVFNNQTLEMGDDEGAAKADNSIWTFAGVLIIVIVILGVLIVVGIVTRSNRRVKEYIPDGRMEPLADLEAMIKPVLGPGVSIEHAPLPGVAPRQVPGLPPGPVVTQYGAAAPLSLPAAGVVQTTPAGEYMKLPALPAAQTINVTPTTPAVAVAVGAGQLPATGAPSTPIARPASKAENIAKQSIK